MFRCPVCREPLRRATDARAWRCGHGHSYDIAREGYVNLLITHQRRAREPGDSMEMLRHRRAFLDAGHYGPIASALHELASAHAHADGGGVLDAGCGEGYYTRDWHRPVWGVDIARAAVRMAAKRASTRTSEDDDHKDDDHKDDDQHVHNHEGDDRNDRVDTHTNTHTNTHTHTHAQTHNYAVASVYDLPIVDDSIAIAVNVFAPVDSAELARAINAGGILVTVTPGPDHLAGLKALLFAEPDTHDDRGPLDDAGDDSGFTRTERQRVRYDLDLTPPAIGDLLGMVPYAWYVDPETRSRVEETPFLRTPVDVNLTVYTVGAGGSTPGK